MRRSPIYRSILAPIDGTPFGENALPLAAGIARRTGAVLHVVHVHEPLIAPAGMEAIAAVGPWNDILKEQESEYLNGVAGRLEALMGTRVRIRVMDGPVTDALEEYAAECEADLLVMSTHGHAGIRRLWHHNVAEELMDDLALPALLVRTPQEDAVLTNLELPRELRHILVPLDGAPDPFATIEHAVAVGRGFHASYTLLRVVRPNQPDTPFHADHPFGPQSPGREHLTARQYLGAAAEQMRAAGHEVRAEVLVAPDPGQAIVAFVRAAASHGNRVDLITMLRHTHRGFASSLASHTSSTVVRDCDLPVLLVHGPITPTHPEGAQRVAAHM